MAERMLRWRDLPRVIAALAAEAVLLGVLWAAAPLLGSVPLSHLGAWVQVTAPAAAITAIARLGGMVLAGWLLASTVLYVAASLAGAEGLIRRTGWVTLPVVRRMVDGLTAASILAATVTSGPGAASAAPAPAGSVVHPPARPRPATPEPATTAAARAQPRVPAVVNDRVVGRHLPHPGFVEHASRIAYSTPAPPPAGQGGEFAGLAPGTKVVVVQPGDCLSVIAEQHLGDWRLDTEIHQLNVGRVQPDGRALTDDHWIYPGWVLVMPADAVGTQVVPGPTATAPPAQPPPTPAVPRPRPPASSPSSGSSTATPAVPGQRAIPSTGSTSPAGADHSSSPGPPAGRGGQRPPASGGQTTGGRHPSEPGGEAKTAASQSTPVPVGPIVGVAGLVAAGVTWRLRRRRSDQMHGRRSGRSLPVNPPPVVAAEIAVRVIADGEAMRWVDAGLRYLGGQLADRQTAGSDNDSEDNEKANDNDSRSDGGVGGEESTVPSVVLVRAGGRGLEVMIAPACSEAPEGWEAIDDGSVWALRPEIDLDDLEARAAGRWAFLPAVVTVGTTVDGTVLANLEHAGSLAVEGDPGRVRAVLGQMLVELTSQPWADQMFAGLHALGDLGAQQLAGVDVDDDPMVLAETLDRTGDRTIAALAGTTSAAALSAAARRAVDGEWLPEVVVAFADTDPKALRCLIEAAAPDRSGVAVVAAGAAVDARWRLTVDGSGSASLAGLAGDHRFRLPLDVAAQAEVIGLVGQALSAAADPADRDPTAVDPDRSAVDQGRPADEAGETGGPVERGAVEIRFLGTVRVVGDAGRVDAARRDASLAVLAYLATRARPVSVNDLAAALWPPDASKERFGTPAPKTVHNVVSRSRALLGADAEGEHRLRLTGGGYVLAASVTSDWGRFQALVAMGRRAESTGEKIGWYRQALELVEGAPFAGSLDSQFFEWVSGEQLEYTITATVVDAAEELARLALEAGDHDGVAWAVERGLGVEPAREQLYQYWMHALGRSSDADRVTAVWKRLCTALQAHIDPAQGPSPDSQAVYRSYVARQATRP